MHDIEVHARGSRMSSRSLCRRLFEMIDAPFNRFEPPAANEQNRRCTERLENCRVINARVGLRLLPVHRDILRKCGGSAL